MFSTHEVLLFHTPILWLLKGNVLNNVYEIKDEIKLLSELKVNEFLSYFSDEIGLKCLAYLAEMFEKLNNINLKQQGTIANIIQVRDESFQKHFIQSCRIGFVKQYKKTLLCLRNCQVLLKKL